MDNYLKDLYGGGKGYPQSDLQNSRSSLNAPVNNQSNQYQNYASAINQKHGNLVPRLSQPIHKGINNALAARMQQLRQRKIAGSRHGAAGIPQRQSQNQKNLLKQWNSKCSIQNITIPQIISSPNCAKRYRITLTWVDETGRPHRKDINFGEQGKSQFIDHKDTSIRDARLAQLKQQTLINPLHPNFWQFHLLNKYPDLNLAYFKFIQENNLTNRKVVLKKQFRRNSTMSFANTAGRQLATSSSVRQNLPQSSSKPDTTDYMDLDEYKYAQN